MKKVAEIASCEFCADSRSIICGVTGRPIEGVEIPDWCQLPDAPAKTPDHAEPAAAESEGRETPWDESDPRAAFVAGASFCYYQLSGGSLFWPDRGRAEQEAERRYGDAVSSIARLTRELDEASRRIADMEMEGRDREKEIVDIEAAKKSEIDDLEMQRDEARVEAAQAAAEANQRAADLAACLKDLCAARAAFEEADTALAAYLRGRADAQAVSTEGLRDYFAGIALGTCTVDPRDADAMATIAGLCYVAADAMLKARGGES